MVDQKTKQDIYETYMAKASQELSKQDVFDMNSFQRYMRALYIEYTGKQGEEPMPDYYMLREASYGFRTFIDESQYEHLSDIFIDRLDSILQSNISNPFVTNCKNNSVACNQTKNKPCKYCIKYNTRVKGFKLTNAILNKVSAHPENAYSRIKPYENIGHLLIAREQHIVPESYNKLKDFLTYNLITIHTSLPMIGNVPTSSLSFRNRFDEPTYNYYGYYAYTLCIMHTPYEISTEITKYVSNYLWGYLTYSETPDKEKICYAIHWLLAIACPFLRGSAGFAKVMLNAALLRIGKSSVEETPEYKRKTDWVAILTPTFDEYYVKKDEMFQPVKKVGGRRKKRCTRKNKK
jgi:hypothetical protein